MKKLFISLILLLALFGCQKTNSEETMYFDFMKLLQEREEFTSSSLNYNISYEITSIGDNKYRYFVTIDKPKIAMYDIEVMAIEQGKDYSEDIAASAGILSKVRYNMIPNQSDVDKGYISGINISGESDKSNPTLLVLVQWHNRDLTIDYREYFRIELWPQKGKGKLNNHY